MAMLRHFKSICLRLGALTIVLTGCTSGPQQSASQVPSPGTVISAEQASFELAQARAEFVSAYDVADVDRFVAMFDRNATYSGLRQTTWVKGKDEIRSRWAIAFEKDPARNFEFSDTMTYLSPDNQVAVDTGYARMMMAPKANTPVSAMHIDPMRASITWIRTDQGWKIVNMAVSPRAAVAPGFLRGH
jgi:hypothetical protein